MEENSLRKKVKEKKNIVLTEGRQTFFDLAMHTLRGEKEGGDRPGSADGSS